ncbi:MAG: hypothetical protein HY688_01680 [Chloroflexi bacterium]|nr:hypothetical protein [Chloroflexota bacterium]
MPKSKYVRPEGEDLIVRAPDGTKVRLVGAQRMHFYRLAGATPEEATDEQVERYFALRAQEEQTGQRVTPIRTRESAAEMVTRELRILNLPQVLEAGQTGEETPEAGPIPSALPAPASPVSSPRLAATGLGPSLSLPRGEGLPPPPRYQPGVGMPPPPRYDPQAAPGPSTAPRSRYVRRDGTALHLQAPDGTEQRVTQYMRVHFQRMLEKDVTEASDEEIEMWWKLQGSLEPGTSLPEAQSQRLLTEALQAAGKLQRAELEMLHQTISAWLEARKEDKTP